MIRDIKTGKWSLKQVQEYARMEFGRAEGAYLASKNQEKVDRDAIEKLMMRIIRRWHKWGINQEDDLEGFAAGLGVPT